MLFTSFLPKLSACLCVLTLPLGPGTTPSRDLAQADRNGWNLTPKRALKLEEQLEKDANNLVARATLISYYGTRYRPEQAATKCKHILWIIRNHPESEIAGWQGAHPVKWIEGACFAKASKAWQQAVAASPNSAPILGNAAGFFLLSDPDETEQLLLRAREVDPNNGDWAERVGHFYSFGTDPLRGGDDARKSLKYYEIAMEKSAFPRRASLLLEAARMALASEQYEKAARYARQLLDAAVEGADVMSYARAVHHGNLVLGHVALSKGDIAGAERYLLLAGRTPGGPSLNSFGPNMLLAKELLERGRKETVLEYLVLCGKFWKRKKLNAWIKTVKDGGIPDFGKNLIY